MNEKEGKNIYYIRSVNYTGDGNMIYVRAYICYLFICMYIYIHIQINKTHTHTHTHTHIYIYIYIYVCVCMYIRTDCFRNRRPYFRFVFCAPN